jgi:hypothetical protein
MIPGFEDTLRINGKATITVDPAILERAMVDRKQPKVAIRVAVEEAFFHCAKAFRRSRLWQPDAIVDRKVMPTLARIILEQTAAAEDAAARRGSRRLRHRDRRGLPDSALLALGWSHFLRRTGGHFGGKCSASAPA